VIGNILVVGIVFAVLVFIHELGHLLACKVSGIKVEKFSIGFGPALVQWKSAETTYMLCIVPLGGYIKMEGEDFGATGFFSEPFRKKALVLVTGPGFNLILGFVLMAVMFAVFGWRVAEPRIAPVPGTVAESAGLVSGDLVLAVNGDTVKTFSDLELALQRTQGQDQTFRLRRGGETLTVRAHGIPDTALDISYRARVGRVYPGGPAAQAGLQAGDIIVGVDSTRIAEWGEFTEIVRRSAGKPLALAWLRGSETLRRVVTPREGDAFTAVPASQPGVGDRPELRGDDRILSVDTLAPAAKTTAAGARPVRVRWLRGNETLSQTLTALPSEAAPVQERVGQVGIEVYSPRRAIPVLTAIGEALKRTGFVVVQTFVIIWQLITGQVSARAVSGPVMVAKIAYEGAQRGGEWLLALWAMLAINLFVVNMLPVPFLDGGRVVLFAAEAIRRRKFSARQWDVALRIGLHMVVLLVVFALSNDFLNIFRIPVSSPGFTGTLRLLLLAAYAIYGVQDVWKATRAGINDEWVLFLVSLAENRDAEAVRKLVGTGVDMNARTRTHRLTALQWLILGRKLSAVRVLIDAGADVNACENHSPLMVAAAAGDVEAVRLLLEHKANVNAPDSDGKTALHIAAVMGRAEVAGELLKAGAALNARDQLGRTPLLDAAESGRDRPGWLAHVITGELVPGDYRATVGVLHAAGGVAEGRAGKPGFGASDAKRSP
jgi:regulator of sigma E protease